jgi:hypothetical protein
MPERVSLKTLLKRGALIAAANWPVTLIQFIGASTFKILLAIPTIGGALLVGLVLGRDLRDVVSGDMREVLSSVASALLAEPIALTAFVVAFSLVLFGGASLMFLVKGGTVSVLAEADRLAGPIEKPPLRLATLWRTSQFTVDRFTTACVRLWRRYLRLGLMLIGVYAVSAALYFAFVFGAYSLFSDGVLLLGWTIVAGISSTTLVAWITLVNFLYLLVQISIAVDGHGVRAAVRRVARFLRADRRRIFSVFGILLLLVVAATVISFLVTAGLSLIAFVPVVGLVVLPLQLAAWLCRGLMFEYLGTTALATYLRLYRDFASAS